MNAGQDLGRLAQSPPRLNAETGGLQPIANQERLQAEVPAPWREFGLQVLAVHHRSGLGAQCVCGSLMCNGPVIEAAERLGLPTDDPRGRG